MRLSRATTRSADKAIDLFFSGPLQIASLRDDATFHVRIDGVDVAVVDKSYAAAENRLSLVVDAEIAAGARIEVAWQGVRDARGVVLAAGYTSLTASS